MTNKEIKEIRDRLTASAIASADACTECVSTEAAMQHALAAVASWSVSEEAWMLNYERIGFIVQTAVAVIKTHYEIAAQEAQ